jgi:hypothetical protein
MSPRTRPEGGGSPAPQPSRQPLRRARRWPQHWPRCQRPRRHLPDSWRPWAAMDGGPLALTLTRLGTPDALTLTLTRLGATDTAYAYAYAGRAQGGCGELHYGDGGKEGVGESYVMGGFKRPQMPDPAPHPLPPHSPRSKRRECHSCRGDRTSPPPTLVRVMYPSSAPPSGWCMTRVGAGPYARSCWGKERRSTCLFRTKQNVRRPGFEPGSSEVSFLCVCWEPEMLPLSPPSSKWYTGRCGRRYMFQQPVLGRVQVPQDNFHRSTSHPSVSSLQPLPDIHTNRTATFVPSTLRASPSRVFKQPHDESPLLGPRSPFPPPPTAPTTSGAAPL